MDQQITWPERLTPPLRYILGRPNFTCGSLAHAYQALGEFVDSDGNALNKRAEDEQAFVIHRFVAVAAREPDDWEGAINREVKRVAEALGALKLQEKEDARKG